MAWWSWTSRNLQRTGGWGKNTWEHEVDSWPESMQSCPGWPKMWVHIWEGTAGRKRLSPQGHLITQEEWSLSQWYSSPPSFPPYIRFGKPNKFCVSSEMGVRKKTHIYINLKNITFMSNNVFQIQFSNNSKCSVCQWTPLIKFKASSDFQLSSTTVNWVDEIYIHI